MIELTSIFIVYVIASTLVVLYLIREGRKERESLEDRLMALSKPDALITHKALGDDEPAKVDYVDEQREYELAHNGEIDLLGDED